MGNSFLFKQQSVSVEELSTDSCRVEIWCSQNKYASFKNINFFASIVFQLVFYKHQNSQYLSRASLSNKFQNVQNCGTIEVTRIVMHEVASTI